MTRWRALVRGFIESLDTMDVARRLRALIRRRTSPAIRKRQREYSGQFADFAARHRAVLAASSSGSARPQRTALVVSSRCPSLMVELALIKTLQLAGFKPVVLIEDDWLALRSYYQMTGVAEVRRWSEFWAGSAGRHREAREIVERCRSFEELLGIDQEGIRVGRIAASSAIRQLRLGSLDWSSASHREAAVNSVASSIWAAGQARRLLDAIKPDLVLFADMDYTPKGELFDACLTRGLDVVAYDIAHKNSALMFKRYSAQNREQRLASLSTKSWELVQNLDWTAKRRDRLEREFTTSYARGEWFRTHWTRDRTTPRTRDEVHASLGLDPSRRTAFVFPHIVWDAPLLWGSTLFVTHEQWVIETVRAACRNDRVNWVIKIHPGNVLKLAMQGHSEEPAELRLLRENLGALPPHIAIIPENTKTSTLALLQAMDYCVTVRGTVGIEAARLGIPVLTSAVSRYSGKGFTYDSHSQSEYIERLSAIEQIPRLSEARKELAQRFAYGLFVLRPLVFNSMTWSFNEGGPGANSDLAAGPINTRINANTIDEFAGASDISALAAWLGNQRAEDYLTLDESEP